MYFLEFVKWFEGKISESGEPVYPDFGWISMDELDSIDPDNTLLDSYEVMKELVNPLGTIFWFLVRKELITSCQKTPTMQMRQLQ